ncbi:MAG: hypothetical protein JXR94_10445, partial [Candidatus Hydrogenedentes bacterium]|nr:hypothetical protein [Candidatus Hydrogenedentota bacterium]
MRRITKTERRGRSVLLHAALIAGSFVFSIPFIWLISTSCKVSDEMYPPRWIPQVPPGVKHSPYIGIRQNERAVRPVGVRREDWERLSGPIREAITEDVAALADGLPAFYRPYLREPDLAEGVLARLVRRAPDALFSKPAPEATTWFAQRIDEELVRYVFESVYRRVAVSDVKFHGWDVMSVEYPTEDKVYPWEVVSGDAELVGRREGLLREAREVHYRFDDESSFTLGITLPLEMEADNLKKIVISNHADRSWHEIRATVELAGRRYRA